MQHIVRRSGLQVITALLALASSLASALAAGSEDNVNVDGVWGISEQGTAGEGVNCDRWASGPGGAAVAVSDDDPGIQDQAKNDENQIRYGAQDVNDDPPPCHAFADQSGFGFDGADGIDLPTDGSVFKLGVFTHYNAVTNIDLADYNPLENVGLAITLSGSVNAVLDATVGLFETANDDDPCRFPDAPNDPPCGEKVTIASQGSQNTLLPIDGKQYSLTIAGFSDCNEPGSPRHFLFTHEMAADEACLYARLIAVDGTNDH